MNASPRISQATIRLSPPLDSALELVHSAIEGMSVEQMSRRNPGKWSAAEILEHLSLTYSHTVDLIQALLPQDWPEARRRSLRQYLRGIIVLRIGRIPAGRKSLPAQLPKGLGPDDVKAYLEEKICRLDEALERCERRFGCRARILSHHILGPLSTADYRRFHWVHTQHHIKQVRALRNEAAHSR